MTELWAVHIEGPDDILAMPDRDTAERVALEINDCAEDLREKLSSRFAPPHISAAVIEYVGTAEEHAANLAAVIAGGEYLS